MSIEDGETEIDAPEQSGAIQPSLFREIDEIRKDEKRQGRYTAEELRRERPSAYAAVVNLISRAKPGYEGMRRIAKIVGVHHLTVAAVRDREGETIDTLRDRLSKKALLGADLLVDRVLENPDSIPANILALAMQQLVQMGELLGNRATSRTEEVKRVEIHDVDDWRRRISNLPSERELSANHVRVIDSGDGKFNALERPIAGASDLGETAAAPRTDAGSDDSRSLREGTDREATAQATTPPADTATDRPLGAAAGARPDARKTGAGGVAHDAGEASRPILPVSEEFLGNGPSESNP
jgi:hypothetical protein